MLFGAISCKPARQVFPYVYIEQVDVSDVKIFPPDQESTRQVQFSNPDNAIMYFSAHQMLPDFIEGTEERTLISSIFRISIPVSAGQRVSDQAINLFLLDKSRFVVLFEGSPSANAAGLE